MINHALKYAALGWSILPCEPGSKAPVTTLAKNGVHSATSDETVIREWWAARPDASIGLACGEVSGVIALDLDARSGGIEFFEAAVEDNSPVPDGVFESHTGGGGFHYLFQYNGERSCTIAPGVEIISDGHYIVLPPSVHPSGNRYEWELSSSPIEDNEDSTEADALAGGDDSARAKVIFGLVAA